MVSIAGDGVVENLHPTAVRRIGAPANNDLVTSIAVYVTECWPELAVGRVVRRIVVHSPSPECVASQGIIVDLEPTTATWAEADNDLVATITVHIAQGR